jgi:hypothetical protein
MTTVITLKAQAKNLKLAMEDMGITLTHGQSLEAIAKQYNFPNWDTLAGVLNKEPEPLPAPRLADMPDNPSFIYVEGLRPSTCMYSVDYYAADALALLPDEKALRAYVEKNIEFLQGMDSLAIELKEVEGEEERWFTFNQLLGIRYADMGQGNWQLRDGKTYLRFVFDEDWEPAKVQESSPFAIPQMLKSTKGCSLVQLPSHDGSFYDKFVLVPPQLDVKTIAQKLSAEIFRLKEKDLDNALAVNHEEYTANDIATFATSLGCTWVAELETISSNWD